MKTTAILPLLVGACLAGFTPGARAWVYQSPVEFQADGDFDGDGLSDLVIVDRVTGSYRIAYQTNAGSYLWVGPFASGIPDVSGVALGKLLTLTRDALAFTAPAANRVNLVDAGSRVSAGLPTSLFITNLGPTLVGAIDLPGTGNTAHDDLYISTRYDSGSSPCRWTTLRNTGASTSFLDRGTLNVWEDEANRVILKTTAPPRLASMSRDYCAGEDALFVHKFTNATPTYEFYMCINRGWGVPDYLIYPFASTNPLAQVLRYNIGWTYLFWYQVTEPASGSFSFNPTNTFCNLSNAMDRVYALPGASDVKLLVLFNDGAAASVYSFNGVTAPVLVRSFTPNPGEHFTGAGILGGNGFMAYSAPLGQRTSSKFKQWNWNGSKYTSGAAGDLPRVSAFSSAGNVLQFRYEPFVNTQPVLLRLNNAGDWASRPQTSGVPATLSVRSEAFLSPTQGLGSPVTLSLGQIHPQANFDLVNQYTNVISLYSFQPAMGDKISEVTILPAPGAYDAAINVTFSSAVSGHLIYFRVGLTPWQLYSNQPLRLFTNAVIQYYGQAVAGATKSALKTASYTFKSAAGSQDSNRDGLPDYVAIARGLDPNGSRDSDGDGFSDLEELLHNTDPLSKTNFPSTNTWARDRLHVNDQATFDLRLRPTPWDGTAHSTRNMLADQPLYAYDLNGLLLGSAPIGDPPLYPAALFSNLVVNPDERLFVQATPTHYAISTTFSNQNIGREMVGLLPIPSTQPLAVTNLYLGGNITNEALTWILAASNAWWIMPRLTLTNTLSIHDTLGALLFEKKVADLLGARGYSWSNNLTLFPHRIQDVTRTNPPLATLLSLESALSPALPGYKLQNIFTTVTNYVRSGTNIYFNLYSVAREIYDISGRLNDDYPTLFASPVDEIRYLIWNRTLDSNYLANTSLAYLLPDANRAVSNILKFVPARPTTNVDLVARSDTFTGAFRLLGLAGGGRVFSLLNESGLPYSFPGNFDLVPGALLKVAGYTDVTNTAGTNYCIQVTNVMLVSVPLASDNDLDGNLLPDTWENQFFGFTGQDPFADNDGDHYSNLQEMLDGSDPRDTNSIPTRPLVSFTSPRLYITSAGTNVHLFFTWPAAYQRYMTFGVRSTATLGTVPFVNLAGATPLATGSDWMYFTLPAVPDPSRFYHLWISLGPDLP